MAGIATHVTTKQEASTAADFEANKLELEKRIEQKGDEYRDKLKAQLAGILSCPLCGGQFKAPDKETIERYQSGEIVHVKCAFCGEDIPWQDVESKALEYEKEIREFAQRLAGADVEARNRLFKIEIIEPMERDFTNVINRLNLDWCTPFYYGYTFANLGEVVEGLPLMDYVALLQERPKMATAIGDELGVDEQEKTAAGKLAGRSIALTNIIKGLVLMHTTYREGANGLDEVGRRMVFGSDYRYEGAVKAQLDSILNSQLPQVEQLKAAGNYLIGCYNMCTEHLKKYPDDVVTKTLQQYSGAFLSLNNGVLKLSSGIMDGECFNNGNSFLQEAESQGQPQETGAKRSLFDDPAKLHREKRVVETMKSRAGRNHSVVQAFLGNVATAQSTLDSATAVYGGRVKEAIKNRGDLRSGNTMKNIGLGTTLLFVLVIIVVLTFAVMGVSTNGAKSILTGLLYSVFLGGVVAVGVLVRSSGKRKFATAKSNIESLPLKFDQEVGSYSHAIAQRVSPLLLGNRNTLISLQNPSTRMVTMFRETAVVKPLDKTKFGEIEEKVESIVAQQRTTGFK